MDEKERAIEMLAGLSEEQAAKVLIFMAGLEAARVAGAEEQSDSASSSAPSI